VKRQGGTARAGETASGGAGLVWWIAGLVTLALSVDAVGAAVLRLLEGRTSANAGFWAALVAALGLCLIFPLLVDLRITRAYRRLDAGARATPIQALTLIDALILAVFVVAFPRFTRASLESHGAWVTRLAGGAGAPTTVAEEATGWLAHHIPRSAPTVAPLADAGPVFDGADAGSGNGAESARSPMGDADTPDVAGGRDPQSVFQTRADTVAVIAAAQQADPKDVSSVLLGQLGVKTVRSFGSGFFVATDGRIVTCHHVIDRVESLQVLAVDKEHDLALLTIDTPTPAAPLAPDDSIAVGQRAIAIGSPLGLEYSVTDGILSAVRDLQGTTFLQMQTTVAPGSSGGPLFDVDGRVIGVNTATEQPGLNLAVHVKHVRDLLAKVPKPRTLATFSPGAHVANITVVGAELSSVDKVSMQKGLELLAAGAEGCVESPSADAYLSLTFKRPAGADPLNFHWALSPTIDSNLPPAARTCMSSNLRIFSMAMGLGLAQAFGDELAAGSTVVMHAAITGLHGHAGDERKPDERTLDVRFVMNGGGEGDAGAVDAGR